jgi:PAS domain S-box-containing protein
MVTGCDVCEKTSLSVSLVTPEPSASDISGHVREPWRHRVARGTLNVCAVVAPLLAALGLFVGSTEREAPDIVVLLVAGISLPALRWARFPVQRRAVAAIFIMLGAALYLTARAGFAAGVEGIMVTTCVLGVVVLGRRLGVGLIAVSALGQVIIGFLVVKRVFVLDPREVDPLLYGTWLRMAASTSLLALLLALVIDFVIGEVESGAGATAAALKELRAAHAAVRESEERYRSVVDHSLDGVLLTAPSGETLEANPAACQILQRTAEEIRALGRDGVMDTQDPSLASLLEERRLTGKLRGELTMIRKDGKRIPVDLSSSMFRDRHGELRTSVSFRDLTDRRRSEQQQRILAELGAVLSPLRYESPLNDVAPLIASELADLVMFYVVQPDGDLHRVAAATREPKPAWIADTIMTSLESNVRPLHPAWRAVRERVPIIQHFTIESLDDAAENPEHLRALRALGLRSYVVVPMIIGDSCVGVLGLASSSQPFEEPDLPLALEIGRRCALFIESARLHRSEKRAIQARDEVLAIVAHDLRNPIANMMFQLALLRRSPGEPERRSTALIEALEHDAQRMSRILDDLVDISQLDSGRLQLNRAALSPAEIIVAVSRTEREQIESRSLALRTEVAGGLPDVSADRSRILQVFENLISNAIKFTLQGSISLGARAEEAEVVFWVADSGVGIGADDLARVFDRFWQGRRFQRSGVGLGLAIVREIVEAHGGRLWVESTLGAGSTFYFTLPAIPSASISG